MIEKLIILCILLQIHQISAQNESPPSTCNSCCQGQAGREGNPGIPGVPGTNGNPGLNGQPGTVGPQGESVKGERGDVGAPGQKGDSGSSGSKGDQGLGGSRGSPGKTGPVGITGPGGSPGSPGVKGQKGEMGQSQQNLVSAFTAVRSTSFTPSSVNIPLPFEQFKTSIGNDFDLASGHFTCEIPGIYLFTYSLLTSRSNPFVTLMKDDAVINSVYNSDNGDSHEMLSNAAVLQLNAGEQVWLRCGHSGVEIHSNTNLFTSFSGVLLHEI